MQKSKWIITGTLAAVLAFGFVMAGCEHGPGPKSATEVAAIGLAAAFNYGGTIRATADGTTVTLASNASTNGDVALPAGVTLKVLSGTKFTLKGELTGGAGTKLVLAAADIELGGSYSALTNFYNDEGAKITAVASVTAGTYVWTVVFTPLGEKEYGWLKEAPASS